MITSKKLLANLERKPITADVFLTDYCNNKCPHCTYARYGEKAGRWVSAEDFKRNVGIVRQWGVKGVILTGGGEPTINPEFGDICRWLEDESVPYGMNTNLNRYVEVSPRYLKVSLDAWDEDSYERKRGVRAYRKTVENIVRYAEWKKGTNLGIQALVTDADEIQAFYDGNRDLPVDYIVFRPVESTGGSWYEGREVEKEIEVLEKIAEKDGRVVINPKWRQIGRRFDRCYAHDFQVAIDCESNLIYCCHKPYEKVCKVYDADARERYSQAVTNMAMCDVPCRLTASNELMEGVGDSEAMFI